MRHWINLFETATGKPALPNEGETPYWVPLLEPLTRKLADYLGVDAPWDSGCCFEFAEALHDVFGGELWGVYTLGESGDDDDWDEEHAVIRINGVFYDFDGVFSLERYRSHLYAIHGWRDDLPIKMLPGPRGKGHNLTQEQYDFLVAALRRKIY